MEIVDLAAKRYAQAAFELAQESGDLAGWQEALNQMGEFMADPEVLRVLDNTRVPVDSKMNLLETALADLPPMPLNLARLLVRKGRTRLARDIAAEFTRLSDESQGIQHAVVTTAIALSDAEREALVNRLQQETGQRVVLTTEVNPDLLGGIVLQVGDKLVDSSTRGRLQALRESLVGAV